MNWINGLEPSIYLYVLFIRNKEILVGGINRNGTKYVVNVIMDWIRRKMKE